MIELKEKVKNHTVRQEHRSLPWSSSEYTRDRIGYIERAKNTYGNVAKFRWGVFPILLISEPDLIQQVLVTEAHNFKKGPILTNNRAFFGNGLLSSEGNYWKRQRKLASPAFTSKRLEEYAQIMVEHGIAMLNSWHSGQTLEIQHEMMKLTLAITTKTFFDTEISLDDQDFEHRLHTLEKLLAQRINNIPMLMLPDWVPFPTNIRLRSAIKKVDEVIYGLIKERRSKTGNHNDLLSLLIDAKDEDDGSAMSDQQIRDEVFTLFFAGHETTALALTWTLWLIAKHPQVERQVLEELQHVLNGRRPTAADYWSLRYIEKVVKESMRLRPPAWAMARRAIRDCVIGDLKVKNGTAILISQWLMHHDERYFKDAETFDPDRWNNNFSETLPKFAYFPFGGGPRICIGNGFAMTETVLLLAMIMQKYHLSPVPDHPVELLAGITLRAAYGIKMTLGKR